MKIDTKNLVSITDANQNFSNVAKKVEQSGEVIILKNNVPKYVVSKFNEDEQTTEMQVLSIIAKLILTEHINAFKELAK
ncbi:MAG: type II toxin-antitoxin system prevent-host-death family antitoxin [Clostridia bacterium]|nr:type II toxin-antitoxin system prevent-host-death family antitoxin [Clostridia bacterium]